MNAFEKLIRPSAAVRSRFHDGHGRMAKPGSIVRNLPRAAGSKIMMWATGELPDRPWLSYDAVRILQKRMAEKPCSVLEFGSGASTAWFAMRAGELHSVESDPQWQQRVAKRLAKLPETKAKVEYELRTSADAYCKFRSDTDRRFDIILVDGPWRHLCARNHVDKLAVDGILYLDNSDAESSTGEQGEMRRALHELRAFARRRGLHERIFTDFSPCALHVSQGVMFAPAGLLGGSGKVPTLR